MPPSIGLKKPKVTPIQTYIYSLLKDQRIQDFVDVNSQFN